MLIECKNKLNLLFLLSSLLLSSTSTIPTAITLNPQTTITYPYNVVVPRHIDYSNGRFITNCGGGLCTATMASPTLGYQSLPSRSSLVSTFVIYKIPEESGSYLFVDYTGKAVFVRFAADMNTFSVEDSFDLVYFEDVSNYVYRHARKPNTTYLYITSLVTKIIYRVDLAKLSNSKRIVSTSSESYETCATTPRDRLVMMSANGLNMELWSTGSDNFVEYLQMSPFVYGNIFRSVAYYPIVPERDYIFAAKTGGLAYFFSIENKIIERTFSISNSNPEFIYHIPQTRYMVVVDESALDFIDPLDPLGAKRASFSSVANPGGYGITSFVDNSLPYLLITIYQNGDGKVLNMGNNFCHQSCKTCTKSLIPEACTLCQDGYTLSLGKCVLSSAAPPPCQPTEYASVNNQCVACPTNCQSCLSSTGFCTQCVSPKVVSINGDCVDACSNNEYLSNGKCMRCHPTCSRCSGPLSTECIACPGVGNSVKSDGRCNPPLSCGTNAGYTTRYNYIENSCMTCSSAYGSYCNTCTMPDLGFSCLDCATTVYNFKGECMLRCPRGTARVSEGLKCVICEESDLSMFSDRCVGPNDCPDNYKYDSDKNTCVPINSVVPIVKNTGSTNIMLVSMGIIGGMLLLAIILGCVCSLLRRNSRRHSHRRVSTRGENSQNQPESIPLLVLSLGPTEAQPISDTKSARLKEQGEKAEMLIEGAKQIAFVVGENFTMVDIKPKKFSLQGNNVSEPQAFDPAEIKKD